MARRRLLRGGGVPAASYAPRRVTTCGTSRVPGRHPIATGFAEEELRLSCDGRKLKHLRTGDIRLERIAKATGNLTGEKRRAAELEEVVVNADSVLLQRVLPDFRDNPFKISARRDTLDASAAGERGHDTHVERSVCLSRQRGHRLGPARGATPECIPDERRFQSRRVDIAPDAIRCEPAN